MMYKLGTLVDATQAFIFINDLPEKLDKQNGFLHNMLNKVQKQATSKGNNHLWLHHNISWKDSMHSRCYANLHIPQ